MNLKTAKHIRKATNYQPGRPAQYEKPELQRIAQMPKYLTHTRILRSWNPKTRKIKTREVERIILSNDGKTSRGPVVAFVEEDGKKIPVIQSELIPITKPIRLKKGSPKALYRALKKQERRKNDLA